MLKTIKKLTKFTLFVALLGTAGYLAAIHTWPKVEAKVITEQEKQVFKAIEQLKEADQVLLQVQNAAAEGKELIEVITLTEKNSLTFRGPVTAKSVAEFQKVLFELSSKLPKESVIYLVVDSPGGSVIDGNYLIDSVKAIPQKVKTISLFSASMAFQMVQNFEERLVTPSGILMSHRASGGFEGEFGSDGKGELMSRLKWILAILKTADENASKRMSISLKEYQELIADEYWTTGRDAVKDKAADRMVLTKCSDDLVKATEIIEINSFFGRVVLVYSKCPLITYPIDVKMSFTDPNNTEKNKEFTDFINKLLKDKKSFVQDYIINNKFERIVL